MIQKHPDLASLQAQSTGEDSNGSDHSAASDAGDYDDGMNGSMDQRFSNFLGLQGLLPGPSGMHSDSFGEFNFHLVHWLLDSNVPLRGTAIHVHFYLSFIMCLFLIL